MAMRNRPIPPTVLTRAVANTIEHPMLIIARVDMRDVPGVSHRVVCLDDIDPLHAYNHHRRQLASSHDMMSAVIITSRHRYKTVIRDVYDPTPLHLISGAVACTAPADGRWCALWVHERIPPRWLTASGDWSYLFRHTAWFTTAQRRRVVLPPRASWMGWWTLSRMISRWDEDLDRWVTMRQLRRGART